MLSFYLSMIETEKDKRTFEDIYFTYRDSMFYLSNLILKNTHDSEDAVQNAFIGIARNMKLVNCINDERDLRNYVLKAAKNASLNISNSRKVRKKTIAAYEALDDSDGVFIDVLCENAEYQDVRDAMMKIDEKYRDALYYHYVLGFQVNEISKLLDVKASTIKKRIYRGRKMIFKLLSIEGD